MCRSSCKRKKRDFRRPPLTSARLRVLLLPARLHVLLLLAAVPLSPLPAAETAAGTGAGAEGAGEVMGAVGVGKVGAGTMLGVGAGVGSMGWIEAGPVSMGAEAEAGQTAVLARAGPEGVEAGAGGWVAAPADRAAMHLDTTSSRSTSIGDV